MQLLQLLRQQGYRITPQRELILKVAAQEPHHLTAEAIFERVQKYSQAINMATIYRTLDLLVTEGLFRRTDLGEGHFVYTPIDHGPHVHLVCYKCQHVVEVDYPLMEQLQQILQQEHHFQADLHHISIFGLCAICQPNR